MHLTKTLCCVVHKGQPLLLAPILLAGLLLAGCTATPVDSTRPLPDVVEPGSAEPQLPETPEAPPPPSASDRAANATLALLNQSERLRSNGDIPAAISTVERAIRLDPNNAKLWLELGRLQLSAGKEAQAEQLVRKSIALVRNDPDTEQAAWLALADIKEAKGDLEQARALRRQWRSGSG